MHPGKRECNGWVLCKSTRFFGKYYYFNPATGEAVWNLTDMDERRPRPNFMHPAKWHSYPEPETPPEEANSPWGYQPDFKSYRHLNQPTFGQSVFPKYVPTSMDNMHWGVQPMYMKYPLMNAPSFYDPVPQMWPNYGPSHSKQYINNMQDNNLFPTAPYMQKGAFNQGMVRQGFCGANANNTSFQNRENFNKRMFSAADNIKEPLLKKFKSQTDLQNENLFKKQSTKDRQCNHCCKCNEKLFTPFSKSTENIATASSYNPFDSKREGTLKRSATLSKSMTNLTDINSPESSNFSPTNSFIFPLKRTWKSTENLATTFNSSPKKKVQNSTITQSGQDTALHAEKQKNNIEETDLRFVLLAKRKSSSSETKQQVESKKIKTCYSEQERLRESQKKKVTFNLGVEDSVMGDHVDTPIANDAEDLEPADPESAVLPSKCYIIPDVDVLLTEFELLEEYIKCDPTFVMLVSRGARADILGVCGARGGARGRVLAARHVARRLAEPHELIEVEEETLTPESCDTGVPILNTCLYRLEQGFGASLITNNQDLLMKAGSLDIECYTTKEVKDYIKYPPEVSFDFRKSYDQIDENDQIQENELHSTIPVQTSRKILFNNQNQFFLNNPESQKNIDGTGNEKNFDDNFLDLAEVTNRLNSEIGKLNLKDSKKEPKKSFGVNKPQIINETVVYNSDEAKAENDKHADVKKIQNINIYNIGGFLKSFSIKSSDMEERIAARMDEYVCVFTQIMEDVVQDVLMNKSVRACEDPHHPPLWSLLHELRDLVSEHRTARVLVDRLGTTLSSVYRYTDGRIKLNIEPSEFVKMFGCGVLLVNVLESIYPANTSLSSHSGLLSQLSRSLERWPSPWEAPPAPPDAPDASAPRWGHDEHTQDFVKDPSEVLNYVKKHYWDANDTTINEVNEKIVENCRNGKHNVNNDRQTSNNEDTQGKVDTNPKVVRTFGRNIGLLKLDPKLPIQLDFNKENKLNNIEINTQKDKEEIKVNDDKTTEVSKPKLLRKLALNSTNLPPKFKDIDVEKRENENKKVFDMLNNMISCKVPPEPITKYYNLSSVIVKNNDNDSKLPKIDTNNDRKLTNDKVNDKTVNGDYEIVSTTKPVVQRSDDAQMKFKMNGNETEKVNNSNDSFRKPDRIEATKFPTVIKKHINGSLDLDVLDYDAFTESHIDEATSDNSSRRLGIIESDNCNDVTTTQHNDSSPEVDNHNINGEKERNNENNERNNGNNDNDTDDNGDSGIYSEQAYSYVQLVLVQLSKTFKIVTQFISASMADLKCDRDENMKDRVFERANKTSDFVQSIIHILNQIIERESNPDTAITPLLSEGSHNEDKRVAKYRRVMSKCVVQARILRSALDTLRRTTGAGDRLSHITDTDTAHSHAYSNIFED